MADFNATIFLNKKIFFQNFRLRKKRPSLSPQKEGAEFLNGMKFIDDALEGFRYTDFLLLVSTHISPSSTYIPLIFCSPGEIGSLSP